MTAYSNSIESLYLPNTVQSRLNELVTKSGELFELTMSIGTRSRTKDRRNVSLDPELNEWLAEQHHGHASELIEELLMAYRAYGGDVEDAGRYVAEKRVSDQLRDRR